MQISRRAADDEEQSEVDVLTMGCVRWRTNSTSDEDMTMLVTVYGAGCRPRYRCARVLRQSSSLLYLQLSDASSWPLVRSPRDPVDCHAFQFDRWTPSPPAVSPSAGDVRTTSGYLLSLVADRDASVDCRLPPDVAGVQYEAEFVIDGAAAGDNNCSGTLTESGRALRLVVSGCGSVVRRQFADPVYKCLESSTVTDSRNDMVIITSSGGSSESLSLSCWLFTRIVRRVRGRTWSSLSFYLLTGEQCHTAVTRRSSSSFRPSRPLIYTAFFSRPRPQSLTTSPRQETTTPQSPDMSEPVTPSTAGTSKSPQRPRPHNVTVADLDEDEQSGGFVNAFVLAFVAVLMAVIQLLMICRCI